MKNFGTRWLMLAGLTGLASGSLFGVGCGGGNDNGTGNAGTTGHAGTTGAAGHAGTTGTAGTTATAGTTGTGGGGTTGTAGASGTTGGGGNAGGGATGNGGALGCPALNAFDATVEGFALNTYQGSGNTNLADLEGGAPAMLSWTNTDGSPTAGALKITAPFSDYNQSFDVQLGFGSTALKNWSGYKLHVRVKVASGLNPSPYNPADIQPHVSTGTGYSYCGGDNNLIAGNGWNEYILDLSKCPSTADPSMIIAYGLGITSGNGINGDAGVNPAKPTAAVVYIDSFWLEGSCGSDGGTAGSGGGTGGAAGGTAGAAGGTGGAAGGSAGAGGTTGSAGTGGAAGATAGSGGHAGGGAGGAAGGSAGAGGTTGSAGTGGAAGATAGSGGHAGGGAGGA